MHCSAPIHTKQHISEQFIEKFKALGDLTRLRILNLLILHKGTICVCEIVDSLEENQYNISKHLKILKNVELINEHQEGRYKYFSLSKDNNSFNTNLFTTISSIKQQILIDDHTRLKKRLEIRKGDKCVLGIQKKHLLSRKDKGE